ncbi:cell division protein PerM [Brachybacterium sp. AOP42-C2-15]|uniref:cell division protein PerM n=1 Tax=Brachybacterium sp. AOP42-C2-15 TaxID=3457670 RepID=UPI0040347F79
MSSTAESIATPLVRGVLGALTSLGIAVAVVVVPALAAQVAGTASTATALDAIIISLNLLILGHGGGIMLSTGVIDGAVTLTPFGLLLLLVLLSASAMRRVGRALRPVRDDGLLRTGALRDVGSALGMYALVYAIGLALVASIGRSADSSPMVTSAVVSGAMVAVTGGLIGLLWSLRREPTESVPGVRVLDLLPAPYGDIARSALLAVTGLLGVGMAVVVVMLLLSVPAQSALFDGLAPGPVGGLVLALVQLALLPLLAVWALTVVLGGTVGVGTATGISLAGAETGVLPALPLLGALPAPGSFPGWAWVLMILPAIPVALGAVRLVRDVAALERRDRITAWVAYPLVVIVALLLLAGLSTGGIGDGRLVHLGPQMSTLVLPLIGVVVLTTAVVLGVLATPLIPWTRDAFRSMRERVEAAERTERSGDAGGGEDAGGEDTATADGAESADSSAVEDVPEPVILATADAVKLDAEKIGAGRNRAGKTDAGKTGAGKTSAEASADLEPDAWSLDTEDASDPAQPGSGISRRTDR